MRRPQFIFCKLTCSKIGTMHCDFGKKNCLELTVISHRFSMIPLYCILFDMIKGLATGLFGLYKYMPQYIMYILQSCGFGGLWRFAGPFTKANNNAENVELFNNALEALVETCLPVDEMEEAR